jgi:hypothetical protein
MNKSICVSDKKVTVAQIPEKVFLGGPPVIKTQAGEKCALEESWNLGTACALVNGDSPRFGAFYLAVGFPVPRYFFSVFLL